MQSSRRLANPRAQARFDKMRYSFSPLLRLGPAILLTLSALPALALDSVTISVAGGDDALKGRLESSSMLKRQLDEQEAAKRQSRWTRFWRRNQPPPAPADPAETLANARAEYRRLLSVLYGQGRYGGVISVKLDGREAADISLLEPPATIRNAVITVQPGPEFTFSEASIKPLAPDTELPEEYARGEIAKSTAISDAARVATNAWRDEGHAKADLATEDITANHAQARLASRLTLTPAHGCGSGRTLSAETNGSVQNAWSPSRAFPQARSTARRRSTTRPNGFAARVPSVRCP